MKRAFSVDNVLNAKFKGLEFENEWYEVFGTPERAHSWLVWGQSGSGKTTFLIKLAKYLSGFEKVLYNSMEEGLSLSMKKAYQRAGVTPGDNLLMIQEPMADLTERLLKPKSPNIIFIDSVRYARMNWKEYQRFCAKFPTKLFIWVSHAKGKDPKGALAEDIRYDSFVKIYVEGFRAFVTSRFSVCGESTMDIWYEGAQKYWAKMEE